jgi:ABC-type transport system involved in multi-copper enzyme maturation permease subunit
MGLLRADLIKLARHPLLRWLVLVLLALVLLRGWVLPPDPKLPWTGLWSIDLIAIALIMLAAVTVGLEFTEDTFRSMVSRGVPRGGLLLSKFVTLILAGGVLLVVIEGLATLLGVRSVLRWSELWRAWLGMWPYIAMIILLTVLARNGGLALVVGVLWLPLEKFTIMIMGSIADIPQMTSTSWRFFSHEGVMGKIYQWSLSYHSMNWTHLAEWQRAPTPMNTLLKAMPSSPAYSALVLAGYTLLGLGLSLLIVHRRDVTEVMEGKKGLFGFTKRRARSERSRARPQWDRLPALTGKGPIVVRLVRAHAFKTVRTSLIKIGLVVSLLLPLTLWGVARLLQDTGFEDLLFKPGPEGGAPLAITISLLLAGPLATVLGILAVSNELSLGTRRAELTRGVTRTQTIIAQSLALILTVGAMFAFLMAVVLVIGAALAGNWAFSSAALTVLVTALATGSYIGAAQIGGALFRSPLGAMLAGLLFLVADWFAILAPTLMVDDPGPLLDLGRYAVFANTFALANRGEIVGVGIQWPHLSPAAAFLLLLGYAVGSHALAALVANWRDA